VGEGIIIARESFLIFENLLGIMIPANIENLNKDSIERTMRNFLLDKAHNLAKLEMKKKIDQGYKLRKRKFANWLRISN
jgi:hypothetical protein